MKTQIKHNILFFEEAWFVTVRGKINRHSNLEFEDWVQILLVQYNSHYILGRKSHLNSASSSVNGKCQEFAFLACLLVWHCYQGPSPPPPLWSPLFGDCLEENAWRIGGHAYSKEENDSKAVPRFNVKGFFMRKLLNSVSPIQLVSKYARNDKLSCTWNQRPEAMPTFAPSLSW